MSRLLHKPGVRFDIIAEGGAVILKALARQARLSSWDWVISSGTDGAHSPTSRHPKGEAFDVSVANFPNPSAIVLAYHAVRTELGPQFTVLFETPYLQTDQGLASIAYTNSDASEKHFHVQVKKGTSYPPAVEPEGTVIA